MGGFGCDACYEGDALAAWNHVDRGRADRRMIAGGFQELFRVGVRRCESCGQAFLFIHNEELTYSDSDNYWYETALPVTPAELAGFTDGGVSVLEAGALGATRRRLESVSHSGQHWDPHCVTPFVHEVSWATGEFAVRRDT